MRSATALILPRLSTKSAIRGSPTGYLSCPILISARCITLLRRNRRHGAFGGGVIGVGVDPGLDHRAEIADEALDRPRCRVPRAQMVWPSTCLVTSNSM